MFGCESCGGVEDVVEGGLWTGCARLGNVGGPVVAMHGGVGKLASSSLCCEEGGGAYVGHGGTSAGGRAGEGGVCVRWGQKEEGEEGVVELEIAGIGV